ncbi:hypothetical protein T3H00_29845 [Pseudomonas fluorescens]|uniref:hypothetical protein n=1 Tax=Pseudomonas fluorescens TaxID=294 RepID=UPI002ACA8901|nr:hypothetical protein [Pseudomonas fluorescens]MDZ5436841.1 hypothetical protein [Pseudomonas fluorescens]
MPLTAFSASRQMELDVDQLLQYLADIHQRGKLKPKEPIPDIWKQTIHSDLECPACFVRGAEVVRASSSKVTGEAVKQAYFRFPGGHHPFCDFAILPTGEAPEGLVQFISTARDGISRAIRDLVCKGIQIGVMDQVKIRGMREWFHHRKLSSQFHVSLDQQVLQWVAAVQSGAWPVKYQPQWLTVNQELLDIPGFDLRTATEVMLARRHASLLTYLLERAGMIRPLVSRIAKLASDHQGRSAFDPTSLKTEYDATLALAHFISHHYEPVRRAIGRASYSAMKGSKPLMAFTALLLFLSNWNLNQAAVLFARIAGYKGYVDQSLGNVMGLNPFHDYEAWSALKVIQEIPVSEITPYDLSHGMKEWIEETATALRNGQTF